MFRWSTPLLFLMTPVVAGITPIRAQPQESCITAKCHAEMGKKAFVHGPVGAGACTVCHNPVPGKKHQFVPAAEKEALCLACHDTKRDMLLEDNVHTPVAEGDCVGCHDPHQSDFRFQLKGQAADLCFTCHDREPFSRKFVHGPVGAGDCNACHNPHASANAFQLRAPEEQLCLTCHKEKTEVLQRRHVHPPVAEKCVNCHSPHSDTARFMLGADVPDLCFTCHEDLGDVAARSNPHPPVASGQCLKCHDVHATDNPKMFVTPAQELCFSCHEDLGQFIADKAYKHGPVKQGDCNACHNPHGSEYFRMLRKYFPSKFYMPYAPENYALCFDCHNKDIALDEKTRTLTDFRNGEINLHYKHVNKKVKGRSCKACHQVHASDQEKHIRKSVPFGAINWELPVTFTKFEDGGRCVVGCHAPKEYRRK